MKELTKLCRPNILNLKPYSSARSENESALIFLDANENPYPPYPATTNENWLNRYPQNQSSQLLRIFSNFYKVNTDQILISRGADEAIDLLVRAYCEPQIDQILINSPTFPMYEMAAKIQNCETIQVDLTSEFQINKKLVLQQINQNNKIKLIFFCSPNNPTGNLLDHKTILEIAKFSFGKCLIIIDHTYIDFSCSPPLTKYINEHPNLVILRTLSKEYGLAGERIGITLSHPIITKTLKKIIAPYPIPRSSEKIAINALSKNGVKYSQENIKEICKERGILLKKLATLSPVKKVHKSDANFIYLEIENAYDIHQRLQSKNIQVRFRAFTTENTSKEGLRISIGNREENIVLLNTLMESI